MAHAFTKLLRRRLAHRRAWHALGSHSVMFDDVRAQTTFNCRLRCRREIAEPFHMHTRATGGHHGPRLRACEKNRGLMCVNE